MLPLTFAAGVVALLSITQNPRPTLATQISNRGLPAPGGAADLDKDITSFEVLDDPKGFVIAYYLVEPDGLLHELRVRTFDKGTRMWRYGSYETIGSVLHVARGRGFLYVSGHSSPSAAPTLVLNDRLQLRRTLDGWVKLVLPDGRLIFERSMRHFQPTHAAVLGIYDPPLNVEQTFYPWPTPPNDRGFESLGGERMVDRDISDVKLVGAANVQFSVVTQPMKLAHDRAEADGPERTLRVDCAIQMRVPRCVERPAGPESRRER